MDGAEAYHMPPRDDGADPIPMEEWFEGIEPFDDAADSSQLAPDAGTPSPKRLKLSEKGVLEMKDCLDGLSDTV